MVSGLNVLLMLTMVPLAGTSPDVDALLIADADLQSVGLSRFWQAELPLGPDDSIKEGHLVDEALYVTTNHGSLFALKADVGLLRWGAKLTEPGYTVYPPTHARTADGTGPVVIPTTTETFIHDRYTGALVKRFTPWFAAGSAALVLDDALFVGSANGRFYALLLNHPRSAKPFMLWEVMAGGPITAAPVLYDGGKLLFATQGGMVYSCAAADKTLLWAFRSGGHIDGDPAVDESGAYVASADRSLYKLSLTTGRVIWRVRFPRPLEAGPVVTAHTVYQFCERDGLSALDAHTGVKKWRHPRGRKLAAHSAGGDIIFTVDRRLEVVDHETGEVRGTVDATLAIDAVSNTRDDAVYLLGSAGRVLCLRLDDVPYLRRQQVIAARQQFNLPPASQTEAGPWIEQPEAGGADPLASDPLRSRRDIRP